MALTIVATAGASNANSYVTAAEATTYMAARLNSSAWTDADDSGVALAEATREIDLCAFAGYRSDDDQALQWPRQSVLDPDAASYGLTYYDSDEIPTRVKNATCELALEFLKAGTTDVAALDATENVIRKTVDVLTTEYVPVSERARGLARYPRVLAYLRPLLASSGGRLNIVRG